MLQLRTIMLLETVKTYSPHILLVDNVPLGMKKELLPSLEWLRENNGSSITVLGMRDILDEPQKVIRLWKQLGVYEVLRNLYDRILIYGSPLVFDPVGSYEFPADVKAKVQYCGYVSELGENRKPSSVSRRQRSGATKFVVVTIGGGEWLGETVIGNFLGLLREHRSRVPFESIILTGPFLPEELWRSFREQARDLPTRLIRFVPHTRPLMIKSDLVISTVGYNTITDIMSFARRALVIPRIKWRKEQLIRAERLSHLGLLSFMHPDEVTPRRLYTSIMDLLNDDNAPLVDARSCHLVNLDGACRLAEYMGGLFERIGKIKETTS